MTKLIALMLFLLINTFANSGQSQSSSSEKSKTTIENMFREQKTEAYGVEQSQGRLPINKYEGVPETRPTMGRRMVNALGTTHESMILLVQENFRNKKCGEPKGRFIQRSEKNSCSANPSLFVSGKEIAKNIDKNYFDWAARHYHNSVRCRINHYKCFDPKTNKDSGASRALQEGFQSLMNLQINRIKVLQGLPLSPELEKQFQSYWKEWANQAKRSDQHKLLQITNSMCEEHNRRLGVLRGNPNRQKCNQEMAPRLWFILGQINLEWATLPTEIASILENIDLYQLLKSAPPKVCGELNSPEIQNALKEKNDFLKGEDLKLTSSCSPRSDGKGCFYEPAPPTKKALWTWIKPPLIHRDSDTESWYCENELKYGRDRESLEKSTQSFSTAISIGSLLVPPARAFLTAPITPSLRLQFTGGATINMAHKKIPGLAQTSSGAKTIISKFNSVSLVAGWGTTSFDLLSTCFPDLKNKVPRARNPTDDLVSSEECSCQDLAPDLKKNAPTPTCLSKVTTKVLDNFSAIRQLKTFNDVLAADATTTITPRFDQRIEELLFPFTDQGQLLTKEALPQLEAWSQLCAPGTH